MDSNNI